MNGYPALIPNFVPAIAIRTVRGSLLSKYARLCIVHQVFAPRWDLVNWMITALIKPDSFRMSVATANGFPIAVCMIQVSSGHVAVFVIPEYRRRGVGSSLVSTLCRQLERSNPSVRIRARPGDLGSAEFWRTNKIPLFPDL